MKINILFLSPSLRSGGAEKVLITLLKHLDRSKFRISLALVNYEGIFIDELPKDINVINFNRRRSRYIIIKFLKLVWATSPDIICSSLGHLNLLIIIFRYFLPANIKFVCRETNIPSIKYKRDSKYKLYTLLYRNYYKKYDRIICQSKDMQKDLINNFNIPELKTTIIKNPCDLENIRNRISSNSFKILFQKNKYNVLSVGSLSYQKGFDLLLHAIAKLDNSNFHFTIIGEGPEKEKLKKLAIKLNIIGKVNFLGLINNPYPYMNQADLFLLSSRYEGFPNVVLESMACGTPVVSFDCPGGLKEIIINGFNGFLASYLNTNDLAEKISLASKTIFQANNIKEFINSKFSIKKIIPKYQKLFDK